MKNRITFILIAALAALVLANAYFLFADEKSRLEYYGRIGLQAKEVFSEQFSAAENKTFTPELRQSFEADLQWLELKEKENTEALQTEKNPEKALSLAANGISFSVMLNYVISLNDKTQEAVDRNAFFEETVREAETAKDSVVSRDFVNEEMLENLRLKFGLGKETVKRSIHALMLEFIEFRKQEFEKAEDEGKFVEAQKILLLKNVVESG